MWEERILSKDYMEETGDVLDASDVMIVEVFKCLRSSTMSQKG